MNASESLDPALASASGDAVESPWRLDGMRRTQARQSKRDSVIRAAAIAFARQGVDGTSMDSLAAALGVTKPTIYRAVGDKDALVRACELRMAERFRQALTEAGRLEATGMRKSFHYLRLSLHLSVEDDFGRLLLVLGNGDPFRARTEETRILREDVEARLRGWLSDDIRAGLLRGGLDPKVATLALFATFNFIPRWYRPDGPMTLDQLCDASCRLFAEGFGGSGANAAAI